MNLKYSSYRNAGWTISQVNINWKLSATILLFLYFIFQVLSVNAKSDSPGPDVIFHNGKIVTVNANFNIEQAIAIKGDRFVAVGDNSTIVNLAGSDTEMVDLGGKTVIPGLNDAHTHMPLAALTAVQLDNKYKVNLLDVPDMNTAIDRIAKQVHKKPKGSWIVTSMYRGASFKEPETRIDLNEVSPDTLVYLRLTGKTFLLNSYGLKKLGLTEELPKGADRDSNGLLTGYFYDVAADYVRQRLASLYFKEVEPGAVRFEVTDHIPPMWDVWEWPAEAYYEGFEYAQRQLNAVGITGVRDMGIWPEQIKAYQRLWREDKLTLRVNMVLGLPTRFLHGDGVVEWIKNLSRVPVNAFGDHRLNYGGLKIDAGNPNFQGEKVRKVIMAANRFGWQLNIHHRGVKGTTQVVLDALRDANRERPIKGRRFTLEHNLELQDPEVYRFLSENDVIVSPNPLYDFYAYAPDKFGGRANTPWESFEKASGEIIPEQYPFRDYESAQLTVTLGSDYPAVNYDREHPFVGFYVAVSKQTLGGQVGSLEQRASRQAALKYFTLNAAYATFEEDVRGSIEVNKLADMVVLSDDLMTVKVEDIKSIVVLRTIMGGKTVYQRQDEIVN